MKITINGQVFDLSDTSKFFLEKYLKRIETFISENDIESDVYEDIEERIAEKFLENISNKKLKKISDKIVIDIVNEIGEPNEILEELIDNDYQTKKSSKKQHSFRGHFSSKNPALTRNSDKGIFFGVCYGIGERYDIDPLWVRLGFVFGTFLWGMTFLLYIVLIFLLPNDAKSMKKNSGIVEEVEDLTDNIVSDIKKSTDKIDINKFKSKFSKKKVKNQSEKLNKDEKIKNIPLKINKKQLITNDEYKTENLNEYKAEKSNIFIGFFKIIGAFLLLIFNFIRIFLAFVLIISSVPVFVSLLFTSGLIFTDFQFDNQILFLQFDLLLKIGIVGILFSLIFFIFGIILKLFFNKRLSTGFILNGLIGLFIFSFVGGIGFFNTFNEYKNIYSKSEIFEFESNEINLDNLDVFGTEKSFVKGLNWIEGLSFEKSLDDKLKIEIVSKINNKSTFKSDVLFSKMESLNVNVDNGISFGLEKKSTFTSNVYYSFLRRDIIIHIPENFEFNLGKFNTHNLININNLYYIDIDGNHRKVYSLWKCYDTNIIYNDELEGFICVDKEINN